MSDQFPEFIDREKYPDFWDQKNNFKEFAKSVGQDVADGSGVFVSEEKIKTREEACNDCSQFNRESKRCYVCGCFMEMKWRFKSAQCPMNIW